MNKQELAEATKEYDRENLNPKSLPVSARERALHQRFIRNLKAEAKRSRGRPKLGKGARSVLITIDPTLLKQADYFAKKNHLSRSALFAHGVQLAISA